MLLVFLVSAFATVCVGRPYDEEIRPLNVVKPPPNCLPGQELVNGVCREIWFRAPADLADMVRQLAQGPKNVVSVPDNCPQGQQWINGSCREVWSLFLPSNVVTVPPNCPVGQQLINGVCREVWNKQLSSILRSRVVDAIVEEFKLSKTKGTEETRLRNIISVPDQCPNGFRPDAIGMCRPIFN